MEKLYKLIKIGGYFILIFILTFGAISQIAEEMDLNRDSSIYLSGLVYSGIIIASYYFGQHADKYNKN